MAFKHIVAGVLSAGAFFVTAAQAAPITFNFNGGCTLYCGIDGPNGNTRSFTEHGVTLDIRAFYFNNNNNFGGSAFLGHYGGGLGVTNPSESGFGSSHTVDNVGRDDYVRFIFSEEVSVTSVVLTRFGDADISYLVGPYQSKPAWTTDNNPSGSGPYTVSFGSGLDYDEQFRLAAKFSSSNDKFKIRSITVEKKMVTVSEPGVLSLIGLGLLGLGVAARRRRG